MISTTTPGSTPSSDPARTGWDTWPVALIGFLVLFGIFIASYVTFAMRQRMDLVGADYYDQEIRFQQQIERVARTARVGSELRLELARSGDALQVTMPPVYTKDFGGGTVVLYRPSDARMDHEFPLRPGVDGTQTIPLGGFSRGLWKARVTWKTGPAEYYRDQSLVLPGGS